jgi:ABC-type nickel/cobalt efflux system permease component RcnA
MRRAEPMSGITRVMSAVPSVPSRAARRLVRAAILAFVLVPFGAAVALAHPLGNFTINHSAGIRVEPDRVLLDVVIDEAEIPTFQATLDLDQDADGELSPAEIDTARTGGCTSVGHALTLTVGGSAVPLRLTAAGVTFPPGNGGLSTMRLVCTIEGDLAAPIPAAASVTLRDDFESKRLGWREMLLVADGVTVSGSDLPATSTSARLTAYPTGLTGAPDVRSTTFTVAPGGPAAASPFWVRDAQPIAPIELSGTPLVVAPVAPSPIAEAAPVALAPAVDPASAATVPGGEGAIPDVLRSAPVTPFIVLLALATAALLGAGHALTPGHGKTLMAAYLVGTRGTPRHALGLGLAVSVSHTFGILALAMVVLAAASALPPDLVVRNAPLVAAVAIVAIGGWMLLTEARRWRARRASTAAEREAPAHDDVHDHHHDHADPHDHAHPHAEEHSHGGVPHRHVPPPGATISWRSLFVLGLAGGLIPSTNALLILLATIASGRPAWGVVLVVAFGLGMAGVMAGVGLAFVFARGYLDRAPARTRLASAARYVPLAAGVLVLTVGLVLTSQALATARLG